MELNSLPMETTVAQIHCLPQHYGKHMALVTTLVTSIKHLYVKIGVIGWYLLYGYNKYVILTKLSA